MPQTIEQLGATVKAKHPEYKDLPDSVVGQKVLEKYSQYQDMVSAPSAQPNSIVGGAFRRAGDIAKGVGQTFFGAPQPDENILTATPAARIVRGMYGSGKEAIGQVRDLSKEANKITSDPIARFLTNLQAGTTAASVINPLATGSVTNINRLESQGRGREAIGQGGLDAILQMLPGSKGFRSRLPPESSSVNKLAFASGKDTTLPLRNTIGDIRSAATPAPSSLDSLLSVVRRAKQSLSDEAANALGPQGQQQILPQSISQRIRALISPNMKMTAAGRAEMARINAAALEFEKPWSLQQLDSERIDANARLHKFEERGIADQYAAQKTNRSVAIDKAIANGVRDEVYPRMDAMAGKPSGYFRSVKDRHGDLIKLEGKIDKQSKSLADQAARIKGGPRLSDTQADYAAGETKSGFYRTIARAVHQPDPEAIANARVKQAFRPPLSSRAATAALPARYATVLPEDDQR